MQTGSGSSLLVIETSEIVATMIHHVTMIYRDPGVRSLIPAVFFLDLPWIVLPFGWRVHLHSYIKIFLNQLPKCHQLCGFFPHSSLHNLDWRRFCCWKTSICWLFQPAPKVCSSQLITKLHLVLSSCQSFPKPPRQVC